MKSYIIVIVFIFMAFVCRSEQVKSVHLYGSLKEFNSEVVNMNPDDAAGDISDARVVKIPVDANGNFDLVLPLEKPGYYQVGRNTLYLTPGDELEVYLGTSQAQSTFKGKGMEANIYLKDRLFPKGGSFLAAGRNMAGTFEATKSLIDSLAKIRMKELKQLKNVSKDFRRLEEMRIKGDIVNSYLSYPFYADDTFEGCKSDEDALNVLKKYYASIKGIVDPMLKELAASNEYLDVAVVRDVLLDACENTAFDFPKSLRLKELNEVLKKGDDFDEALTLAKYNEFKAFAEGLQNKDFREAFLGRLERRAKLMEGRPAIDLDVMTADGKKGKLSDYKGKVMYVDFWATWCGPCMGEMPFFNELSTQYPNIQFIGISVDESEKAWKNRINNEDHGQVMELICHDSRTKTGWDITGIPRFLLIDENFNIISAEAPRPSQKAEIEPLLKKYNTK